MLKEPQLNMLVARDSSDAELFAEQDHRMIAREKQAWQQLNASRCTHSSPSHHILLYATPLYHIVFRGLAKRWELARP